MIKVYKFIGLLLIFFYWSSGFSLDKQSTNASGINIRNPVALYATDNNIQWIDFEAIDKLLGKKPVNVGFDIDDTLITSPIIEKWIRELRKASKGKMVAFKPPENPSHPLWTSINCSDVDYSLVKDIGKKLIQFHKKRGDQLFFITAREKSPCLLTSPYTIQNFIEEMFNIKLEEPIIFVGYTPATDAGAKVNAIKKNKLAVYYGDSDHDIMDAQKANTVGVRVLRPAMSSRTGGNNVGKFSEPVLINSHY